MKLQNQFTTTEQSKRLLEIGVPYKTCDCMYDRWNGNIGVIHTTDSSWEQSDRALLWCEKGE